jgi:TRAP-type C4-dicarboxylate transport system permease small subunit
MGGIMAAGSPERNSAVASAIDWIATAFNVISAVWVTAIAALILYDVVGREFFNAPFYGTNEIVTNSILSILLLQLPLSILRRSSLRTTILFEHVGIRSRAAIDAISYGLAALLFLAIAWGSWPNMIEGWQIGEQEGSGIINIPVYPIRTLVIVVSVLCFLVCLLLIYQSLTRSAALFGGDAARDGD